MENVIGLTLITVPCTKKSRSSIPRVSKWWKHIHKLGKLGKQSEFKISTGKAWRPPPSFPKIERQNSETKRWQYGSTRGNSVKTRDNSRKTRYEKA